jgi:DNA replication protein DnaC
MNTDFSRSRALNTIPEKKLHNQLLEVVQSCGTCKDKFIVNDNSFDNLCPKCVVTHVAFNRYKEANIPVDYWNLKMEKDFEGNKILLTKYNELTSDLKKHYLKGTSICFAGSHGLGKTFSNCCILKKACQKGYTCLYTTLSDVVNVLVQSDNENKYLARRELTMVDFLVIDEFDPKFTSTTSSVDLYARTLESIFRTRTQNKLPTLMATNSPNIAESFSGPMKSSIQSLIEGNLEEVVVFGEDFRKKNKE